jgi:osmotically-inducible protein OsmY
MSKPERHSQDEPAPEPDQPHIENDEERLAHLEDDDIDLDQEMAEEQVFDTQHGEGHTYNVWHTQQQGLTYTPPTDPPIVPSEDRPEGVEIAAGFAPSMEASDPESRELVGRVAHSDLELQDRVYEALRYNSETVGLTNVAVRVEDRVVHLLGTVPGEEDLGLVYSVVSDLEDVARVENHLRVE